MGLRLDCVGSLHGDQLLLDLFQLVLQLLDFLRSWAALVSSVAARSKEGSWVCAFSSLVWKVSSCREYKTHKTEFVPM